MFLIAIIFLETTVAKKPYKKTGCISRFLLVKSLYTVQGVEKA
jgi:hypothetical protein